MSNKDKIINEFKEEKYRKIKSVLKDLKDKLYNHFFYKLSKCKTEIMTLG